MNWAKFKREIKFGVVMDYWETSNDQFPLYIRIMWELKWRIETFTFWYIWIEIICATSLYIAYFPHFCSKGEIISLGLGIHIRAANDWNWLVENSLLEIRNGQKLTLILCLFRYNQARESILVSYHDFFWYYQIGIYRKTTHSVEFWSLQFFISMI